MSIEKPKTLVMYVAYDQSESWPIFFLVDGDYRHLDMVCINGDSTDQEIDELNKLIFFNDFKTFKHPKIDRPPKADYHYFIRVAFLP
jgi:hypothetical protein